MDPLKIIFSIQRLLHRSAGQRAKKKVGYCVLDSGILSDSCRTPDFKKAPWACLEIRKKVLLKINSKLLTGIESPNPLINVKMLYPVINVQMFYPLQISTATSRFQPHLSNTLLRPFFHLYLGLLLPLLPSITQSTIRLTSV